MSNKVTWILEEYGFLQDVFDRMKNHFIKNEIPYHIIKFGQNYTPNIEGEAVVYGSVEFRNRPELSKFVWSANDLNIGVMTLLLGSWSLNIDASFVKLSSVPEYISDREEFFIRPTFDSKAFDGGVWKKSEFEHKSKDLDLEMSVLISSPKKIGREWRLIMVDGKVSSFSQYKNCGKLEINNEMPHEIIAFAENCAEYLDPIPAYTMDICEVDYGYKYVYRVVECNSFNSADFYDCSVEKIIDDVNKMMNKPLD